MGSLGLTTTAGQSGCSTKIKRALDGSFEAKQPVTWMKTKRSMNLSNHESTLRFRDAI